jgi:hypothetical protein
VQREQDYSKLLHFKHTILNDKNLPNGYLEHKKPEFEALDWVIDKLWNEYEPMTGRYIRNLLKMLTKCFPDKKAVTVEMIKEIEEFIPFLRVALLLPF